MQRRQFIAVLGAAATLPVVARAQQNERVRRIALLTGTTADDPDSKARLAAFEQALGQLGWTQGRNVRIDYRFAGGDPALIKAHASELIGLSPDVILASTLPVAAALQQQTRIIPIVFVLVVDPVGQGFVQSLARPGGNITGFGAFDAPIIGKWPQLLKEIAPSVTRVGVIFNPDTAPYAPLFNQVIERATRSFGLTMTLAPVHNETAIEEAIAAHAREPGGGLICLPDVFALTYADRIIGAATRHGLPLVGPQPLVKAGALISYWFDIVDVHAQAASYIDRILKGANPADLPVQQPTKYSLIINLKTAKTLGLTVPPSILDLADEVIE